ncbi:LysR family transcriptional regulator [uncultured Vagococcus sp.]|uniref:winged helix-turn-helix domain-containing protein n=1 Tax=uncultured Vagococcus sp. TaxID=189676 RepID=UPI0028D5A0FF|nr:LysR family transcriptional regulator [uncultured Vagococcus sp.]
MRQQLNYSLSLKLKQEKVIFGPGVLRLLEGIVTTESINGAAKRMGMSYNKAWRILNQAEKELGFKMVEKNVGGSNGGGTTVTDSGKDFMAKFLAFQKKMYCEADKHFNDIFADYLEEGEE